MKVLLIRRGAIGDILMTTPLLRQIYEKVAGSQIDYCVAKSCTNVLTHNKYLNNLVILDDDYFSARGVFKFIKFVLSIRKKYDYVFILGKNWRINLFFKLSGATLVGFAREKISRLLLDKYVNYQDLNRYQAAYYLDLLSTSHLATPDYNDLKLDIQISGEDKSYVGDQLNRLFCSSDFVVVTNSGGNNGFDHDNGIRMLPEDKIVNLLFKLQHVGNNIILLGGKVDYNNYERYLSLLDNTSNIVNLAGKFSISQSTYLLTLAKHFYVTDCGAMHFGLAAGIEEKMTCFFGPTNPRHILPINTKCKVVWQDQDIFDPDYQLSGKINNPEKIYFTKLHLPEIL